MSTNPRSLAEIANSVRQSQVGGYAARAKWCTVRIETDEGVYVGREYVPDTKNRLSDVLNDDRQFINLTEVSINDAAAHEPYVAINKAFVRSVRVLHEGVADVTMGRRSS
jgi:hypothetical protein